jgi:hypothetical protein
MASTFICPKGHSSVDNDFCSECGAKIQSSVALGTIPDAPTGGKVCPDCSAPAPVAGVNFCEICGFNFVTHTSGQFPSAARPAAPPSLPIPALATEFKLIIAVDPTLRNPSSPEAPVDSQVVTYPVEKAVSLVGRRSEARAIFPEVSLDADSAVSHRHGLISKTPDGQLTYRDLSSSNGTRLNGTDITPLVDTPLHSGDQLTLGHWTRITIEPNS